jgi:hypothetical protein
MNEKRGISGVSKQNLGKILGIIEKLLFIC